MAVNNILCITLLVAIASVIFGVLNKEQPGPYMDEIFHIPQAQNYCIGNLSHWNPKITTLPGLYIVSLISLRILRFMPFVGRLFDQEQPCFTSFLRSINFFFMLVNFWLIFELTFMLHWNHKLSEDRRRLQQENANGKRKKNEYKRIAETEEAERKSAKAELMNHSFANAFVLSFFPLLYFFTFLYYTDQGSTSMVLLTYWMSLQESHLTAALTGVVAICFRQTNIIWVAFAAGSVLVKEIDSDIPGIESGLITFVAGILTAVRQRLESLIQKLLPYLVVGIGFCVFVIKNNGIVVGDRSSHQASFHFPQMFYFIGFTMVFSFPVFASLSSLKVAIEKLEELIHNKVKLLAGLICLAVLIIAVHQFTYVHEYLLADNRHYTFYIWRKIFQRHWTVKYLAIPCYIYGSLILTQKLLQKNSILFVLLFTVSVALVTIPQKLLEFRYFIIPYLIFRLHAPIPTYLSLLLEMALYFSVNFFTLLMFVYKPFYWENSKDIQRFMW